VGVSFRDILFVHLDGAEDGALRQALALAERLSARLTLAGCAEPPSPDLLAAAGLAPALLEQIALDSESDALEALRVQSGAAPGVRIRALRGTPFLAVIREVLREGHDLVVVPAPGAPGVVDRILPSQALHLVRKCPVPVWLLRPDAQPIPQRIGAAVEGDPARSELDHRILATAFALAAACGARVDALHVLSLHPSESMLRGRGGLGEAEVAAIVDRARAQADATLRALTAEFAGSGAPSAPHVLHGAPAQAIPAFAREAGLDLLVMGSVGRSGIAGLVIGNTAEEMLQHTECSILALKPPGFVSPVTLD
jgi:universal stress protein E